MHLTAGRQQSLGPEDVGATRQRAISVSRDIALNDLADACRHRRLRLARKPCSLVVPDPMAAEMHNAGAGQRPEQLRVDPIDFTDRPELAAGRRERSVVTFVQGRRALEGRGRGL